MGRSNGSYISPFLVNSESATTKGIHSLSSQQQLKGASMWPNVPYEVLSSSLVASGNITLTMLNDSTANMFKTSGSNNWDASVRGTVGYTAPCTIEFNKMAEAGDNGVSYAMIGWNEDPTANNSYDTLDYAAYPYSTNSYSVYHNSAALAPAVSAWSTALKFYVVYTTAGHINHYNGSTLMFQNTGYGANKTVYFDTSMYAPNGTYGGFTNVRIRRQVWNGTAYV